MHKVIDQAFPQDQAKELGFYDHQQYPLMMVFDLKISQASFKIRFKWSTKMIGISGKRTKISRVWKRGDVKARLIVFSWVISILKKLKVWKCNLRGGELELPGFSQVCTYILTFLRIWKWQVLSKIKCIKLNVGK